MAENFWRPGAPAPRKSTASHSPSDSSSSSVSSDKLKHKRKRKWNAHDNADGSDNLAPLQAPRKTKSVKLSANIKTLKFMQRRTDRENADRAKRAQERALQEQRWVVDASTEAGTTATSAPISGLVVVRDMHGGAMGPTGTRTRMKATTRSSPAQDKRLWPASARARRRARATSSAPRAPGARTSRRTDRTATASSAETS